jgi:threonine dehydratase
LLQDKDWPSDHELAAGQAVVRSFLAATPLVRGWFPQAAVPVYLKLETVQPTGSFKVRGGVAATDAYASSGRAIVTASAGNHGLGVAWAASRLGVAATIVVPETASASKIAALQTYPVRLVVTGRDYDEAERHALALAGPELQYVSPYNDRHVISGQGSLLTETLEQLNGPFTLVVPVGGGGLIAGVALVAAASGRDIRVIGVEAAASRAVSTAVTAGRVVRVEVGETIADGLAGNIEPSTVSPAIIRATGATLRAVTERSLKRGLSTLASTAGIYAEGSAAAGVAALLDGALPTDRPVVIAVTGRNITAQAFVEAILDPAGRDVPSFVSRDEEHTGEDDL